MSRVTRREEIIETIEKRPEGVKRLYLLKETQARFKDIIEKAREKGISIRFIDKEKEKRLKERNLPIYLEAHDFSYIDGGHFLTILKNIQSPLVALFDGIYDPQNFGNILRSAASLGIDGIIIPRDKSCGVTETVKRVSKGGFEFVRVVRIVNVSRYISELKEMGIFVVGLDERGEKSIFDLDLSGSICTVFGREDGLKRLTKERCDTIARIPTEKGFPSLNLATSFAITLYEIKRQRLQRQISLRGT